MRRTTIVALLAVGLLLLSSSGAGAGSNLAHETAVALRAAHHAEKIARAALRASKHSVAPIEGNVGPIGPRGANGPTGAQGPIGATGTNGSDGARGPEGPQGVRGEQGPKGDPEPQGVPGTSVKAYGHVTASGIGSTTDGTTVTHPGVGLYCVVDQGFVAMTVTPDGPNATTFAMPPAAPAGSCGPGRWTVVVSNNSGTDTGFYLMAN